MDVGGTGADIRDPGICRMSDTQLPDGGRWPAACEPWSGKTVLHRCGMRTSAGCEGLVTCCLSPLFAAAEAKYAYLSLSLSLQGFVTCCLSLCCITVHNVCGTEHFCIGSTKITGPVCEAHCGGGADRGYRL